MTQNDNGPVPGRNYRETAVFMFGRKVVFGHNASEPKKTPKFLKRLIFIWEKATFLFELLFPVMVRTWLEFGSELFLGPKSRFLAKKSDFCHTTLILVNGPFVALGETIHFPPLEGFWIFPFLSYSCFRKKNMVDASMRAPSASNSPSALSAQALRAGLLSESLKK